MTREALKKLNEKQMNYCKTLSVLIDRAKIKGLKEENERNRGKLRGFLECMEQILFCYRREGNTWTKKQYSVLKSCKHWQSGA